MDTVTRQIREFFGKLTKKERNRFIFLAVAILALSVTLAYLIGRTNYVVLDAGLPLTQANEVTTQLTAIGVPYKTESGGSTILVPDDRLDEVRLTLAGLGVGTSTFDYAAYNDAVSALGMTDKDKLINYTALLQNNLRITLEKLDKIDSCTAMISLGTTSSYVMSSATPSTATVLVKVVGGGPLTREEATSILNMTAAAVPGLAVEHVTLSDTSGRQYSSSGDVSGDTGYTERLMLQDSVRSRLETQIINLLAPILGPENISVAVNVRLNFDKEHIDSVEFAPPVEGETTGLAVSLSQLYEATREDGIIGGVPNSDANGIGTVIYPYLDDDGNTSYIKWANDVNYELNEVRTSIDKEQGRIAALSAALTINSENVTEDYSTQVTSLLTQALGVDAAYLSVINMPFKQSSMLTDLVGGGKADADAARLREYIILGVKALVIIILALLLFNFLRGIFNATQKNKVLLADGTGANIDYVAGDDISPDGMSVPPIRALRDIELNAKSEDIAQLETFIDRDPQAVAQLLRNWLSEE